MSDRNRSIQERSWLTSFRSSRSPEGPVAQWLEPAAHNGLVAGSSPAGPTTRTIPGSGLRNLERQATQGLGGREGTASLLWLYDGGLSSQAFIANIS